MCEILPKYLQQNRCIFDIFIWTKQVEMLLHLQPTPRVDNMTVAPVCVRVIPIVWFFVPPTWYLVQVPAIQMSFRQTYGVKWAYSYSHRWTLVGGSHSFNNITPKFIYRFEAVPYCRPPYILSRFQNNRWFFDIHMRIHDNEFFRRANNIRVGDITLVPRCNMLSMSYCHPPNIILTSGDLP